MRKLVSILLILLFIPLSLIVTIGLTLDNTILSSQFVIQGLQQTGIYSIPFDRDFGNQLAQSLAEGQSEEGDGEELNVDPEIIGKVINDVQVTLEEEFGPEYIQGKVEPLIENFYAWFLGDTEELRLIVTIEDDLVDKIVVIFEDTAANSINSLPQCASEEEFAQQEVIRCLPPGSTDELLAPFIEGYTSRLNDSVREVIPNEVDIAPQVMSNEGFNQIYMIRDMVHMVRELLMWLIIYDVAVLLLILFVNRQYLFTRWLGATLILGFWLPATIGAFLRFAGQNIFMNTALTQIQSDPNFPAFAVGIIEQLAYYLINTLGVWLLVIAGIPFILGIVLLFMPRKYLPIKNEAPEKEPPPKKPEDSKTVAKKV